MSLLHRVLADHSDDLVLNKGLVSPQVIASRMNGDNMIQTFRALFMVSVAFGTLLLIHGGGGPHHLSNPVSEMKAPSSYSPSNAEIPIDCPLPQSMSTPGITAQSGVLQANEDILANVTSTVALDWSMQAYVSELWTLRSEIDMGALDVVYPFSILQLNVTGLPENATVRLVAYPGNSTLTLDLTDTENAFAVDLTVRYRTFSLAEQVGASQRFERVIAIPWTLRSYQLNLGLPIGAAVNETLVGGVPTPDIFPKPTNNFTDGVRLWFQWEFNEGLEQESFRPRVIYYAPGAPPTASISSSTPKTSTSQTDNDNIDWLEAVLVVLGGAILAAGIIIGSALLLRRRSDQERVKATQPPGDVTARKSSISTTRESGEDSSLREEAQDSSHSTADQEKIRTVALSSPERKIVHALRRVGGPIAQHDLVKQLGWGKSTLSEHLKVLEQKRIVRRHREGRVNKVELAVDPLPESGSDPVTNE